MSRFGHEPSQLADLDGRAEGAREDETLGQLVTTVLEALGGLPQVQREAVTMTKLHGKSLSQAAAETGTTTGAFKQRVHRAYEALRRALPRRRD